MPTGPGTPIFLDEYEICSGLAWTVPYLIEAPPLAVTLRLHSRPPTRKLRVHAVAFTAAAQRLTFGGRGADCTHLAT